MVQDLWADAVPPEAEPGMTLRQPTPSRRDPAKTAVAKTIPHDPSKDKRPESVASTLQVRPQDVADHGELRDPPPHYEILRVLGEGGMGVVYLARQTSIDRTIALKMIKPEAARERDYRNKFLAEAVVTGELDHPNIVPIYDLGSSDASTLFYAMKQVRGTPWDEVIAKKPLDENLDILMRVADAVAFAHSRGIIHRDLKPSNVMLGDFGEVLLMDWGLAVAVRDTAKGDPLTPDTAIGGTPCYMAPEMARGDAAAIGPQSDVYLLGAILYQILTGLPPHQAQDTMKCVHQAAENTIEPTDKEGELVEIALKAMAADPGDRHDGVKAFQEAVRTYQRHEESIALAARAAGELKAAEGAGDYGRYSRAVFGYEEASALWPDNEQAREGARAARLAYAAAAFEKRDFDLALSLLDAEDPEHGLLAERAEAAKLEREARRKRVRVLTGASAALVVIVLIVALIGFFTVRAEQRRTLAQKHLVEKALADFEEEQVRGQADRRGSAPVFLERARSATARGDFEDAMLDVNVAVDYAPASGETRLLRACLLIHAGRYDAAIRDLTACADLPPGRRILDVQVENCRQAIQLVTPALSKAFGEFFLQVGLPVLAQATAEDGDALLAIYQERVEAAWPELGVSIKHLGGGVLALYLTDKPISDIGPLHGIPLTRLWIGDTRVEDLTPLKGMKLQKLDASRTMVADLRPLAGMPLTQLSISHTKVSDLSPLQGMQLAELSIASTKVSDLSPLQGMQLAELSIASTKVSDLSPLQGMPLRFLDAASTDVSDLTPLQGMPLEIVHVHGRNVRDLEPLRGMMSLRLLSVPGAADISPLQGIPLTTLWLPNGTFEDLTPLTGMPLQVLGLGGCNQVRDITPLRGVPLQRLILSGTAVTNLDALTGMPLTDLDLGSEVKDLSPLAGLALTKISADQLRVIERNMDVLRPMTSLKEIQIKGIPHMSAAEFWKRYDSGEFNTQDD